MNIRKRQMRQTVKKYIRSTAWMKMTLEEQVNEVWRLVCLTKRRETKEWISCGMSTQH